MAANVLNSRQAVRASVLVVRAFIRLRRALAAHRELAHKLSDLEGRTDAHDEATVELPAAIRELMNPPEPERPRIGFHARPRTKPHDKRR